MDLLDYAERQHRDGWTFRSALVRLAQPHPVLVGEILTLSRRLDAVLQPSRPQLEAMPEAERAALPLLDVAREFDQLAVTLADWAAVGPENPPIADVERTAAATARLLDELGVPQEDGAGPRGRRPSR